MRDGAWLLLMAWALTAGSEVSASEGPPSFRWVRQIGSSDYEYSYGLGVDPAGNCYQASHILTTAGCGEPAATNGGVVLVKFNSNGDFQWAKKLAESGEGSWGSCLVYSAPVAVDGQGNVTAFFWSYSSTVNAGGILVTNPGSAFLVLAQYDSSGAVRWARVAGWSDGEIYASGLAADAAGNCYWSAFWFNGSGNVDGTPLPGCGAVVKCDAQGVTRWINPLEGPTLVTHSTDLALDTAGELLVMGRFSSWVGFGSTNLSTPGGSAMFLTKYDADGRILWARRAARKGLSGQCEGSRMAIDAAGNAFVTGQLEGEIGFGDITANSSNRQYYLAKYDAHGNTLWVNQVPDGSTRSAAAADGQGNSYLVAERADGTVHYAKYDSAGGTLWSQNVLQSLQLFYLRSDATGNCYLSGSFSSPQLAFDDFTLINRGQSDVFLASFETTTPRLGIGLVTNAVRLSWPGSATNFFLESATNLSPAVVWSSHPATPILVGSWNVVTVPADKPMKFYRLKRFP